MSSRKKMSTRERLVRFYEMNDPSKLSDSKFIDDVLIRYAGKHHQLLESLAKPYQGENASDQTKPIAAESARQSSKPKAREKAKYWVGSKDGEEITSSNKRVRTIARAESNEKKKRAKTSTSEAEEMIADAIDKIVNSEEAKRIQWELALLKKKVDSKVKQFEESAKNDGLCYKGEGAMKCKCGNSFDPEGFYCGMCTGCSSDFCEDCLLGCECGKQWCSECMKECSVEGCDKILCDRCDCSVKCERCSERVCEDTCTREVGNSRFTLTWCIDCEEQERRR
jgi:hypothetical protein